MSSVAIIARAARLFGRQAPWYDRFSTWRDLVLREAMKPKKISPPGRTLKVMPRMFRRGYGLGGLLRRRKRRAYGRRVGGRKKTQNKVHTFVRWCDKDATYQTSVGPNQIVETTADQNLTYAFQLSNCVNHSDFVNLYDRYKINKIQLFLEPFTNQTAYPATNLSNRKIRVVHDYTDNLPLTGEDDYLEYANCKSYNPVSGRTIKLTLYPKILNTVLGGFTTQSSKNQWLSTADDDILHFGVKIFIPAFISSLGATIFRVRAKYWLSMCNSK